MDIWLNMRPHCHLPIYMRKQPFTDVLQNRCPYKFCNNHRKRPVLESLFNKVPGLQACNFIKKRLQQRCFPVNIAKFLRTASFIEHLRLLLYMNIKAR